ncbi:flagellar FliL protein [Sporomusaceae bacterium BoRhaA]|uniref:flagellar basal body-associated FliL family protein n=1 Tax=Pelorhabdus rhamnosifermentans TaxID=2772457 RepID=UPI001C063878|nr:flagellar basal body-associated FliL family protein [Pelorhabdus rhamnosifermentans]MBU2702004.1 flagellar FliL protein [Pelorhabdus rhamnosifermentans]
MAEGEKKFSLVTIIGIVVVGLLLAGGVSYFIATKIVAERVSTNDKKAGEVHEPGEFIKLGDAKEGLIVNMGGVGGRYLKIGIILEMKPDKKAAPKDGKNLSPDEIKVTDTVVYVLRSQKIEDFDPAKQDQLKELIKNEVNKVFGEDRVYNVYITNLVLQ